MGSRTNAALTKHVAPRVPHLAPELTASFVREALHRAIHGVGPLPAAAVAADKQLREHQGDVERAVHAVIDDHVRYAGAQGLLTGLGGVITAAGVIPANVTRLALIQARMGGALAPPRASALDAAGVRNATLACMLGEDKMNALLKRKLPPAPPMALATAPVNDPDLDRVLSAEVTS